MRIHANQKNIIKICLGLLFAAVVYTEFDINITKANNTNSYLASKTFNQVRVLSGDSVWSIASKFVTDKEDIRELVIAIRQINGLSANADIYPGQLLKIPVKPQKHLSDINMAKIP